MAGTMRTGRVYVDNQIPVANDELASKYYADQIASAGATPIIYHVSVDFKATGLTKVCTTEALRGRFMVTEVIVHADNIASLGVNSATFNLGHTAANYQDFVTGYTLPNSSWANGQYVEATLRSQGTSRISAPASTDINVNVTNASNATAYTCTVSIRGFYTLA